jgi:predicted nucleic acid-binding protein
MAVVLRLEKRKLGKIAKSLFESAERNETSIYIPTVVFAEILYLLLVPTRQRWNPSVTRQRHSFSGFSGSHAPAWEPISDAPASLLSIGEHLCFVISLFLLTSSYSVY